MRKLIALTAVALLVAAVAVSSSVAAEQQQQRLQARFHKHTSVVRFFENHRWMLATRAESCNTVPWARTCAIARERLRFHQRQLKAVRGRYEAQMSPVEAICHVFGPYCSQALAVTRCESGHARTPRAVNGQYLGMFQMGSYARARYGHGPTPIEQARAAYRYFVDSGRDWSPWSCKP